MDISEVLTLMDQFDEANNGNLPPFSRLILTADGSGTFAVGKDRVEVIAFYDLEDAATKLRKLVEEITLP